MPDRPSPEEIKTYRAHIQRMLTPVWNALSGEDKQRIGPEIQRVTDYLDEGAPDTRNAPFMRRVLAGEKLYCPVCERKAIRQKRGLNNGMASVLIAFNKAQRDAEGYTHISDVREWRPDKLADGKIQITDHVRDWVKLQLWGLLEKRPPGRTKDENSTGMWRITTAGHAFLQEKLKVPKYVHDYDNECKEQSGPMFGLRDALGSKFNYWEIINL
jgi:hypothetical protein